MNLHEQRIAKFREDYMAHDSRGMQQFICKVTGLRQHHVSLIVHGRGALPETLDKLEAGLEAFVALKKQREVEKKEKVKKYLQS